MNYLSYFFTLRCRSKKSELLRNPPANYIFVK